MKTKLTEPPINYAAYKELPTQKAGAKIVNLKKKVIVKLTIHSLFTDSENPDQSASGRG
jgi:hypothetical protein